MKTTRRGFLRGTLAGAAALVAGIKLPENREPIVPVEEAVEVEAIQPVEEYLAERRVPTTRIDVREFENGILIDGRPFNGNFSISFGRDTRQDWTWGMDYPHLATQTPSVNAELELWVEQGVQGVGLPAVGDKCSVVFPCEMNCRAMVDAFFMKAAGDFWIVRLSLTCWDVVQTGG